MTKKVSDSTGFYVNLLEFLYHSILALNQNKLELKYQATYIYNVLQRKPGKWVKLLFVFVGITTMYHFNTLPIDPY